MAQGREDFFVDLKALEQSDSSEPHTPDGEKLNEEKKC